MRQELSRLLLSDSGRGVVLPQLGVLRTDSCCKKCSGADCEVRSRASWGHNISHFTLALSLKGPSWSMENMWRDLPPDILKKVLTFLPIASLCRFRTVSKEWNRLIGDPDFESRHAQASSPEEYVLITLRYMAYDISHDPIYGWEVLDVANKRFFTFSNDFLTNCIEQEGFIPVHERYNSWHERATLAADGGFFCVVFLQSKKLGTFVFNPVLTFKQPSLVAPSWIVNCPRAVMSTDRISMEYEIFASNDVHAQGQADAILIYESKTGTWRTVCTVPPPLNYTPNESLYMRYSDAFIRSSSQRMSSTYFSDVLVLDVFMQG